jgi:hypothetical protein
MASVLVCGCIVGVCEVVTGGPVAESHVIALGMMGRMAVVCVDDGGLFQMVFDDSSTRGTQHSVGKYRKLVTMHHSQAGNQWR